MMTREEALRIARENWMDSHRVGGFDESGLADLLMETQRQTAERAIEVLNTHIQVCRDFLSTADIRYRGEFKEWSTTFLELARNQLIRELEATR